MPTQPTKQSAKDAEQEAPVKRRAHKIQKVCQDYDVSPATIYRMRDRGEIRIIKVGGASRILEEDLIKLEKREV